jgi:hypothetical protein
VGRTSVQPKNRPRGRKPVNGVAVVAVIAVLLFALVGVVSAGAFVSNKLAGSNKPTARHGTAGTSPSTTIAMQNLARAQAQATAIVQKHSSMVTSSSPRRPRRHTGRPDQS